MNIRRSALVIDDDPLVRQVVRRMLDRHCIECAEFSDGIEAVEKINQADERFDLAIIDLVLPNGPDGWQLVKQIRENEAYNSMPIIIITGALISNEEIGRLNNVATRVLLKQDFSIEKFSSVLEDLLEAK